MILSANCISFANCTALLLCCICSYSLTTFYLLLFCKTSASPAPSPNTLHTCPPLLENHCYDIPQLLFEWGPCSHKQSKEVRGCGKARGRNQPCGGSPASRNRGGSCRAALQLGGDGNGERRAIVGPPATDLCSHSPGCVKDGFTPALHHSAWLEPPSPRSGL